MAENLKSTIVETAKIIGMYNTKKNNLNSNNPWFDNECYRFKKEVKIKLKKAKIYLFSENYTKEFNNSKKEYLKLINSKKKQL